MVLWLAFIGLLLLTLGALLRPLLARVPDAGGLSDEDVYAAQLAEVEADRARGLIDEAAAAGARTEIARRLLRAHREASAVPAFRGRSWLVAAFVVLFVPSVTLAGYALLGAPRYADLPLSLRDAAPREGVAGAEAERRLAAAEARVAQAPDEGSAWADLADAYRAVGRFADAAEASARAVERLGETAPLLTERAESLFLVNGGRVDEQTRQLLERALVLEPAAIRPQILLAVDARQRGDVSDAARRWQALLERSDGTESWLAIARAEAGRLAAAAGVEGLPLPSGGDPPVTSPASPADPSAGALPDAVPAGPDAAALAAAAELAPEARAAMVEGMVERLAGRLRSEGGSVGEWLRLVHAYRVLGREAQARAAAEEALAALDADERARFAQAPAVQALVGPSGAPSGGGPSGPGGRAAPGGKPEAGGAAMTGWETVR